MTTSSTAPSAPAVHPISAAFLAEQLASGKRVLWQAHPDPKVMLRKAMPFLVIGIGMALFAVFFIGVGAMVAGALGFFGLPFVFVGVGFAWIGVTTWRQATRTLYAITEHRALILTPASSGWRVDVYLARDVRSCTRFVGADGGGDLVFREVETIARNGQTMRRKIGFMGIADVGRVEQILNRALLSSTTT